MHERYPCPDLFDLFSCPFHFHYLTVDTFVFHSVLLRSKIAVRCFISASSRLRMQNLPGVHNENITGEIFKTTATKDTILLTRVPALTVPC